MGTTEEIIQGRQRLIVALDHPSARAALEQVDALGEAVERYKVGLELYLACGRELVEALHERDKRVFLDLKLHDIPETVRRAAEIAAQMGVELLTVHAAGGRQMLEGAVAGAGATKVLAVTVLTSLDAGDLAADGIADGVAAAVTRRARLAEAAGCAGVIASPQEAAAIRALVAPGFLVVTPGVRLAASTLVDDQKRVATPRAARQAGADAVVVGRPIRDAQDRRAAADEFVRELA
jgi:orotidine-5'-phosphate decarboxylase